MLSIDYLEHLGQEIIDIIVEEDLVDAPTMSVYYMRDVHTFIGEGNE
jgi:hypothetical protein